MVIQRIGPVSCAKITGTLYAILGVAIGAVVSLIALAGGFASDRPGGAVFGLLFGVDAIVLLPILHGGIGFVATLIAAGLYNLAARLVGGVEIDVK